MTSLSRAVCWCAVALFLAGSLAAAPRPRLVLGITVDQFRYDYLTRFGADYRGGLRRLLSRGAVFTNARYEHFPTVTAIGHSAIFSGATPSISGIVGNDWYDRDERRNVTSVSDDSVRLLGASGPDFSRPGASPRRLLVSTVGDEMKMAATGKSKVIGVSWKDRAAILPAGHMADAAYWFDNATGGFISSTFYFPELPAWVKDFNNSRHCSRYLNAAWAGRKLPGQPGPELCKALERSPFGNELIELFVESAVQAERLGQRGATDLLAVSFSANDYVGHELGPDSSEVREISIETDKLLEKLFTFLDTRVGLDHVLVLLTSDHGVSPTPEVNAARRMPGGRILPGMIQNPVRAALEKKYGPGQWIVSPSDYSLYFNQDLIRQKGLNPAEVNQLAADVALSIPHVFRVYTRDQLRNGAALEDQVGRRVMNGFYVRRSADVFVLLEPYWIFTRSGATHGTSFSYDSHVPVIFMGPGIRPGRYHQTISVNDIAPTLATMLEIETPSGSLGRVLAEILEPESAAAGQRRGAVSGAR